MNDDIKAVLEECTRGSDDERLSFGQVVGKLIGAGVERYHADLQRAEKTYFLPDGASLMLDTHRIDTQPDAVFDAAGVEAAIRAIQQGRIQYREFCERVMQAGCVSYIVSMAGRRAVYYGRTGETHVEFFPKAA